MNLRLDGTMCFLVIVVKVTVQVKTCARESTRSPTWGMNVNVMVVFVLATRRILQCFCQHEKTIA